MRHIQHYELDAQQCELFETTANTIVSIEAGVLWLTIEGEAADHWLAAGESIEIDAARRVWLSAEAKPVNLRIVVEHVTAHASAHPLAVKVLPFLRRNRSDPLSPAPRRGRLPGLT